MVSMEGNHRASVHIPSVLMKALSGNVVFSTKFSLPNGDCVSQFTSWKRHTDISAEYFLGVGGKKWNISPVFWRQIDALPMSLREALGQLLASVSPCRSVLVSWDERKKPRHSVSQGLLKGFNYCALHPAFQLPRLSLLVMDKMA